MSLPVTERVLRSLEYVVDRAVGFVAPETAMRRLAFRGAVNEFGYDAAHPGRMRGGRGGQGKNAASESYRAGRDRVALMWEARDAVRNNPLLAGILHRVGMYATAHLSYEPNTGDEGMNKLYAGAFHQWASEKTAGQTMCDLTGRHTLRKMIELGFNGHVVDGSYGWAWRPMGKDLRLQSIEADRIGSPLEVSQNENYIGGFSLNPLGQVASVRVFERTRQAQYRNPVEINPAQFLYLDDPDRSDQYRGVSKLQVVLPTARDLKEILDSDLAASKWASSYAGFLFSKNPNTPHSALAWDGRLADGTPTMSAQKGKVVKMSEGEDIKFAPGAMRPTGSFLAAVETFIRHMAIGLDLPYGFLYNLALLGGVAQRVEIVFAQRRINYWQQHLLADQVLNPVRDAFFQNAIARKVLPPAFRRLADGRLVPSWRDGDWNFGPRLTGDAGHQTQADIALVQNGFKAPEDLTKEYSGKSYHEVTERIAANVLTNQRVAAETNVPVELQAPMRLANGSQLLGAMQTPPQPPPAPGSQEAIGDKGAANLVEMFIAVTEGRMERDSAIATCVTVYGMDDEQAEEIVPHPKPQPRITSPGGSADTAE